MPPVPVPPVVRSDDVRPVEAPPAGVECAAALPAWFTSTLYAALVAVAACGVVSIVLLAARRWHPAAPLLAAGATVALAWRARPARRRAHRSAHVAAAIAAGIAAVALTGSLAHRSEHLLTDRDPGVYVNTARSIARTHEIQPAVPPSPFDDHELFTPDASGFAVRDGRLLPNFLHLLPAVMATGHTVAGDRGLLAVPPLLGALGLLAAFALAARLVRPAVALLVPTLLAVSPLGWWFARDAYSELVVQFLLLGGLWLWLAARRDASWPLAVVAGFAIGATTLARIDSLAAFTGMLLAGAVLWALDSDSAPLRRTTVACAGAAVALYAASLPIGRAISLGYVTSIGDEHRRLQAVAVASLIAGVVVVVLLRRHRTVVLALARGPAAAALGAGLVLVAAWAWFVRPPPRAELAVRGPGEAITAALRAAISHWHWSHSLRWFGWYLGAFAVLLAVGGWAWLLRRALRAEVPALVTAAVGLPVTVLYLWRPSISPDHFWAMRRYVPVVWPLVAIAIAVAVDALARARPRGPDSRPAPRAAMVAAVLVVVLVPSARAAHEIRDAREQHGALRAVHTVCAALPADAAVLVLPDGALGLTLPPAIRSFCGVPVATARSLALLDTRGLAGQWQRAGRRLFVAAGSPASLAATGAAARVVADAPVADRYAPERSRDHVPRRFAPRPQRIVVAEVTA